MRHDYEERLAARKDRYAELAEKNEKEADRRFRTATEIGSGIPLGQPILVGHHSERGHRAALRKIDTNMAKGSEAYDKAKHYRSKALSAGKAGVSSDDPEAISKLRSKLRKLEDRREGLKKANREYRAAARKGADRMEACRAISDKELAVEGARLLATCHWENAPFPSYALSNIGAKIRTTKDRIEQLEKAEEARRLDSIGLGEKPPTAPGVEIEYDHDANRIFLFFPGKPEEVIRAACKNWGFRWAPSVGAWSRHLNEAGKRATAHFCNFMDRHKGRSDEGAAS